MSLSTVYPFITPANYSYDTNKIEITGGIAKLKLQQGDVDFTETFDSDIGFTYDSSKAEFSGGQVQQKDYTGGARSGAVFNTDLNLEAWSLGSVTGTPTGGATISGGKLDLSHNDIRYVEYDATNNIVIDNTGAIKFKYTPNYTGAPGSDQAIVYFRKSGTNKNLFLFRHDGSGQIYIFMYDASSSVLISGGSFGSWSPTLGIEYEIEINIDITNGATRIFINGNQFGATDTTTGTRDTDIGELVIGTNVAHIDTSNFSIREIMFFDTVQHTSNYTPGYSLYDYKYLESSVVLPEMEHTGDGTIKLFNSFSITYVDTPRVLIEIGRSGNKLYWNGAAWIISDETYTQSTTIADFIANCSSLDVDGENYGQFTIVFSDSNTQSSVSELTANMNVDIGYATDNPYIEPVQPISSIEALDGFSEIVTKAGLDDIKYILYKNSILYYWNGAAWTISDGTYAQSNTVAEIEANKATFTTTKIDFKFRAFLHSNDGTTYPQLDTITVTYDFAQIIVPLVMCLAYGYSLNPDATPNTDVISVQLNEGANETLGNNQASRKTIYITPRSDGYWEQELANNEDMEAGSFYYFHYHGRKTKRVIAKQSKQEYNEMEVLT